MNVHRIRNLGQFLFYAYQDITRFKLILLDITFCMFYLFFCVWRSCYMNVRHIRNLGPPKILLALKMWAPVQYESPATLSLPDNWELFYRPDAKLRGLVEATTHQPITTKLTRQMTYSVNPNCFNASSLTAPLWPLGIACFKVEIFQMKSSRNIYQQCNE